MNRKPQLLETADARSVEPKSLKSRRQTASERQRAGDAGVFSRRNIVVGGLSSMLAAPAGDAFAASDSQSERRESSGPKLALRGVSLWGPEFGDGYSWPTPAMVDYFVRKRFTVIRVPIRWERMQPTLSAELDASYSAALETLIDYIVRQGLSVIIDVHNQMRYRVGAKIDPLHISGGNDEIVGQSAVTARDFADLWVRLARRYRSPAVIFGLMNEPHDLDSDTLVSTYNTCIAAIRRVGSGNKIMVCGNTWSSAAFWAAPYDGSVPNAVSMLKVVDPANNLTFEAHQYFDKDGSGRDGTCVAGVASRLRPFLDWCRANGRKGFIGEFAGGANTTCDAVITDALTILNAYADVLDGYCWWSAGVNESYIFQLLPDSLQNPVDKPQMRVLSRFL